jgi:hypothetical protein
MLHARLVSRCNFSACLRALKAMHLDLVHTMHTLTSCTCVSIGRLRISA